jgi:hypothetical protein
LTAELEKPETYEAAGRAMQINRELVHLQEDLAQLTVEWESEATVLAEIDAEDG